MPLFQVSFHSAVHNVPIIKVAFINFNRDSVAITSLYSVGYDLPPLISAILQGSETGLRKVLASRPLAILDRICDLIVLHLSSQGATGLSILPFTEEFPVDQRDRSSDPDFPPFDQRSGYSTGHSPHIQRYRSGAGAASP